jgi:tripartite-type tricarboxylate transporter receptor subunit TctC
MKQFTSLLMSSLSLLLVALPVQAQPSTQNSYPTKPVRIIVPFAPGGSSDIVARGLTTELKNSLGQVFLIENKPGADGIVAIQDLVRSGADGYTLMIGNVATNAITPVLQAGKISTFDYERDVTPVMRLADIPGVLLASTKDFSVKSVPELIDYAKRNPGKLNYGTPGVGNYAHYDMALFAKRAGDLKMTAIPNKAGATGVINDLLSGTVQIAFLNAASTAGNIQAGTLRPLALANHTRLQSLPNVPTMREVGFPGVGTIAWQGLFAPAGTSKDVLEKVRSETAKALQTPSVRQVLQQQGFSIVPTASLEEAKAWLAEEMTVWRKLTGEVQIDAPNTTLPPR